FFQEGEEYLVAGYPGLYQGRAQFVQPPFIEHISGDMNLAHGQMLPLYYLPEKLRKAGVGEWQFRTLIQSALEFASTEIGELLPESLLEVEHLMPRLEAI